MSLGIFVEKQNKNQFYDQQLDKLVSAEVAGSSTPMEGKSSSSIRKQEKNTTITFMVQLTVSTVSTVYLLSRMLQKAISTARSL